ncbi:MAG: amidohydrolase family protein, partial [Geminicoccaceae bacterium]
RCPEVRFVLDHIGKPAIRDGLLDPWRDHLRQLAAMQNVWCKLSGVVTEADHASWTREQLRPYVEHAVECFGFERVMYGADWPVSELTHRYPTWVEILEWILAGCTEAELRKVFRDNAIAFYRLGVA